jgi:hypothetical protein
MAIKYQGTKLTECVAEDVKFLTGTERLFFTRIYSFAQLHKKGTVKSINLTQDE